MGKNLLTYNSIPRDQLIPERQKSQFKAAGYGVVSFVFDNLGENKGGRVGSLAEKISLGSAIMFCYHTEAALAQRPEQPVLYELTEVGLDNQDESGVSERAIPFGHAIASKDPWYFNKIMDGARWLHKRFRDNGGPQLPLQDF